jgi:hypothetical protein
MINKHREGYILLALGPQHYIELAVTCACSLRYSDQRPIALLVSPGMVVPQMYRHLFEYIIPFEPEPPYGGMFTCRFILDRISPFERCMHIDVDCLLIADGIDSFWSRFSGMPFGVLANKVTSGKLYRDQIDVDALREAGIADGIYTTNWGVFYYETTENNAVFQEVRSLLQWQMSGLAPLPLSYYSRPSQLSDEPFWAIALSRLGLTVPPLNSEKMLQVTSPLTTEHIFDFGGRSFSVKKAGRHSSGVIYHFAAMHPLTSYLQGTHFYRNAAGVPLPSISLTGASEAASTQWTTNFAEMARTLSAPMSPAYRFASAV